MAKRKNQNEEIDIAVMANDIQYIKKSIDEIKLNLEKKYVTKVEFTPIKNTVYGLVGIILTTVVMAVLSLIVKHP